MVLLMGLMLCYQGREITCTDNTSLAQLLQVPGCPKVGGKQVCQTTTDGIGVVCQPLPEAPK